MISLKTATPLLSRVAVFLCLFVIMSGLIGPRIIAGGLMESANFAIYGGLGKTLIFAAIVFALLVQHSNTNIPSLQAVKRSEVFVWGVASFISYIGSMTEVNRLLAGHHSTLLVVIAHLLLVASVALAALAIFGYSSLKTLAKVYKRELLLSVLIGLGFYGFLELVYGIWQGLSFVVMHSVQFLLSLSGLSVEIIQPRTLLLSTFGITVEKTCSGIESIALFTGLYVLIGILDWRKLSHTKFLLVLPVALIALFLLNILRVYGLIMAGYYINPQIAFSLFHTYAGMVFFIVYSGIFWKICYKWMLQKPQAKV